MQPPTPLHLDRDARRRLVVVVLALLLTRGALVALWTAVMGTGHMAGDVEGLVGIAQDPFRYLLGRDRLGNFPPLLGPMMALTIRPLLALGVEVPTAGRLGFVLWEAIAAGLTLSLVPSALAGRLRGLLWVAAPLLFMTAAVAGQEEFITVAQVSGALLALASGQPLLAGLLAGVACAAGKIFALVLVAAIVVTVPRRRALPVALAAAAPIVLAYGAATIFAGINGGAPPLVRFKPKIVFGTGLWTALVRWEWATLATARAVSLLTCAASVGGALLATGWRLRAAPVQGVLSADRPALTHVALATFGLAMALVLLLFYHVNPEYYVLLAPALLALPRREAALALALASAPWATNVLYALAWRVDAGKRDAITALWPGRVSPWLVLDASYVASALASLALVGLLARHWHRTLAHTAHRRSP